MYTGLYKWMLIYCVENNDFPIRNERKSPVLLLNSKKISIIFNNNSFHFTRWWKELKKSISTGRGLLHEDPNK